ncbi:MAG: 4a-hydroxytetrahydrobiopterin dehydratase [Rhodocyclaceae bacterium]|jgi:4a-hydroxytetrahydrobiopterin dehydratase
MLNEQEITARLAALDGWTREGQAIVKTYRFANYHETMAFVNAGAWIAHRADHHPDLEVGYNRCVVRYSTHSAGGLTDKDFACAARLDALFAA